MAIQDQPEPLLDLVCRVPWKRMLCYTAEDLVLRLPGRSSQRPRDRIFFIGHDASCCLLLSHCRQGSYHMPRQLVRTATRDSHIRNGRNALPCAAAALDCLGLPWPCCFSFTARLIGGSKGFLQDAQRTKVEREPRPQPRPPQETE